MADDGEGLTGFDAEGDVAEDPIVFARIGDGAIAEPDVAEFDLAARIFEANGIWGRGDGRFLVEQLENSFGGRHCGLQNVEFFAQVLDGAEEAGGVHGEGGEFAEGEGSSENA